MNPHIADLEREIDWLGEVLRARLDAYFSETPKVFTIEQRAPPTLGEGAYGKWVRRLGMQPMERLILALALAPELRPQLLDVLMTKNQDLGRGFTEFGGVIGAQHGGLVPTGETAAFVVAGTDPTLRLAVADALRPHGTLLKAGLLRVGPTPEHEPSLSGPIHASRERVQEFTTGRQPEPVFGTDFPARHLQTTREWSELVLPHAVMEQLADIRGWVDHHRVLLDGWGMRGRLREGYTALFHGKPGTGKTLSASLLGKHCGREIYCIDLSLIVSKYIGETEKNLSRVFDVAEHRDWILFFDEADALFGKRTKVDRSHDRYANQEVSYLLQRLEDFPGLVILASNMKSNIDEAFMRRFQSVIHFPMPHADLRELIWQRALPAGATLAADVQLAELAARHEISGGTIMNVVQHASLRALARGDTVLTAQDLQDGVRRELHKEGRTV